MKVDPSDKDRREGDGIGVNLPQIVHARLTEILDPLLRLNRRPAGGVYFLLSLTVSGAGSMW